MTYALRGSSILAIAALCHAANAAFCRSLGDDSQPDWDAAPDWQKASAVDGVNFHLANPDAGDAASHENWLKLKEAEGWTYGETKDPEKKTHPCMVPFDQLPMQQQFKDTLFRTLVHQAAPSFAELDDTATTLETKEVDLSTATARVSELETLNGVLTTEKTALEAKLAAADGAPKAKAAKAPKVRKIAEVDGEALTPLELLELVRAAGKVEVAFSDGKRELAEIPARLISGDAWAVTVAGLQLRGVDIELSGVGGAVEIVGYGLLLDGDLVAYRKRMDPLLIAPGAKVSLAGDIVF